jgi:YopX protein
MVNLRLKFRAWHKVNKSMINLNAITPLVIDEQIQEAGGGVFIPNSDVLIVMQYTGLKDKNGQEAYFKDLVFIEPCGIEYESEPFMIDQDDFGIPCFVHPARFGVMITFEDYFLHINRYRNAFEIIGDIFSKPRPIN